MHNHGIPYLVLAGGKGEELKPLTDYRAKSLVRFGSRGTILDFTLYNCLASRGGDVLVLADYQAEMVEMYLGITWLNSFRAANRRLSTLASTEAFRGSAEAVFRALQSMKKLPEHVAVLPGHHICKIDYRELFEAHLDNGAGVTVAAVSASSRTLGGYGVLIADRKCRIKKFLTDPAPVSQKESTNDRFLISTDICVFNVKKLMKYLRANCEESSREIGRDIIARMSGDREAYVWHFRQADGSEAYWRDIRNLNDFWQAQMDLLMYQDSILRFDPLPGISRLPFSSSEIVKSYDDDNRKIRRSMISSMARIGRATVENSIIAPGVTVEDGAVINQSVLLDGAIVSSNAQVSGLVLEPLGMVPPGGMHRMVIQ